MKIFKPLYESALRWAAHPKAPWYLALLSFFEAIIFPVMPEVMLAPMVLAKPARWAKMQSQGMKTNVSWETSAGEYARLFRSLVT